MSRIRIIGMDDVARRLAKRLAPMQEAAEPADDETLIDAELEAKLAARRRLAGNTRRPR